MCGIVGIHSRRLIKPQDVERMRSATGSLAHRGPDGEGIWSDQYVVFGHRRLSILDLSEAGKQPMHCLNGRYVILLNGEIYNFIELRRELMGKGYTFLSETDTEVIAAAYDAWGIDCLHRFNGMWAFALWDRRKEILVLSRDRFGVKPLYYRDDGHAFVFASEVKVLHRWLGKNAVVDGEVLGEIASGDRSYHGTVRTYLREVFSLPAGHYGLYQQGTFEVRKWYELPQVAIPGSFAQQVTRFQELFVDACRLRLRSDVSIGTCLSGGMDSSSIVSVLHRRLGGTADERRQKDFHAAFCASFPGTSIDEVHLAKSLSQSVLGDLRILKVEPPRPHQLERAMDSCDGPMPNLAFYPIGELYHFISQHGIKVTLDGQGPDEMLGGYRPAGAALLAALKRGRLIWAWDVYRTYRAQGEFAHYSAKEKVWSDFKWAIRALADSNRLRPGMVSRGEGPSIDSMEQPLEQSGFTARMHGNLDAFQTVLYEQFFQNTLPMLLHQYDRCSMAHGIECRMPFMDFRLVEFVFSLPNASRVGGGYTKRILREAMKGIVPENIRTRRTKTGFHPPQVDWFRGPLRDWMQDIMASREFIESPFFDGRKIRERFRVFLESQDNSKLWELADGLWGPVHVTWWLENDSRL